MEALYPWPERDYTDQATVRAIADQHATGWPDVFINYRNTDIYAALAMDAQLSAELGPEAIFRASRSVSPGVHYPTFIYEAVHRAKIMLAIVGPGWTDSLNAHKHPYTVLEIQHAQQANIPIVPVFLSSLLPRAEDPAKRLSTSEIPTGINPAFADLYGIDYDARQAIDAKTILRGLRKTVDLQSRLPARVSVHMQIIKHIPKQDK